MNNTEETTPTRSDRKRSSYVNEFLDSERKKARNCLSDTQDDKHVEDLEYMLKSVRALIKIINEIWDNCKGRLSSSEDDNRSSFTFEREVFEEAMVEKNGRKLRIGTQKVSNSKDFGSPPDVPEDLKDLIHINKAESDVLPDYNRYLEKSSIICEDVLLPFLTTFQEHLKEVQVYLGMIEEWLIEPGVIVSFLSKLFNTKLDDVEVGTVEILYRSYCLDVDSKMESTFKMCTEKGREVLKATLTYVKFYNPVTQIKVKDAGEKAVNGTYTLNGMSDGVYAYSRWGVWEGKRTGFHLFRRKSKSDSSIIWCIKCKNQMDSTVKFYWTKATGEENELPALNGWDMEGSKFHGVDPPPQILYKFDV